MIKAWRVKIKRYWETNEFEFKKLSEAEGFIECFENAYIPRENEDEERNQSAYAILPVFDNKEETADEES